MSGHLLVLLPLCDQKCKDTTKTIKFKNAILEIAFWARPI